MDIEEYLNNATDPAQIVSDLIEDLCREYEENPLTVAYEEETINMLIEAFKNGEVTYVGSKEAASESSSRVSDCD